MNEPTDEPTARLDPTPAAPAEPAAQEATPQQAPATARWRSPSRTAAAGAAVAALLVGGVGGFAIGHAAADSGSGTTRSGFPGPGQGGFGGQGGPGGQGGQPGQGGQGWQGGPGGQGQQSQPGQSDGADGSSSSGTT